MVAASSVKWPEICPDPPVIGPLITRRGNDLAVEHDGEGPADVGGGDLAEAFAAADIEAEIDNGFARLRIEARLRIGQILALNHDLLFNRYFAGLIGLIEHLNIVGILVRLADEAEFKLRSRAEDLLQLLGILQPRHFDQNTVIALALNVWLSRAQGIDAPPQHFNRLIDRVPDLVVKGVVRHQQLNCAIAQVFDVDTRRRRVAKQSPADRLGKLAQFRHYLLPLSRVEQMELHAPLQHGDAAADRNFLLAQQTPRIIAQILHFGF